MRDKELALPRASCFEYVNYEGKTIPECPMLSQGWYCEATGGTPIVNKMDAARDRVCTIMLDNGESNPAGYDIDTFVRAQKKGANNEPAS